MKRYILIAGVNGAGKSTLYQSLSSLQGMQRVKKGGHGIPEADIERRYRETFQNLNQVLPKCDITAFYDNTDKFRRFAIYKQGKPVRISQHVPVWFEKNVLQYGKSTPQ